MRGGEVDMETETKTEMKTEGGREGEEEREREGGRERDESEWGGSLTNLPGRMGSLGWLPTQADVALVFSTLD